MSDAPIHEDHWEAWFDANYLRWFHLRGYPALIRIEAMRREELTMRGGVKRMSPIMEFIVLQGKMVDEDVRPLVMNKTNMRSVADIAGTKKVSEFVGSEVVLYESTVEMYDKEKRKVVRECIRIRAPKESKE